MDLSGIRSRLVGSAYKSAQKAPATLYSSLEKNFAKKSNICGYIVDFWKRSTLSVPLGAQTGEGRNLAKYPYLVPSGPMYGEEFSFQLQYRWDTFFQNLGLIIAGKPYIAKKQLMNFVHVYKKEGRIPNALASYYLSHAQPPLESFGIMALLDSGLKVDSQVHSIFETIEKELWSEWLDLGTGKKNPRQTEEFSKKYPLFTRHTSVHFHPLLCGCEDGKDHNWVSAKYGEHYIPVQLNSLIYAVLGHLAYYYKNIKKNGEKEQIYSSLQRNLKASFDIFWVSRGKWKGFRNYSIMPGGSGPILYGDLAAEVFPLFCGIATKDQAEITKDNLFEFYAGDIGLATTSKALRRGGSISKEPSGWKWQWEYPNCWPPLMYVAVQGLKNYGFDNEAILLQQMWVQWVEREFEKSGYFYEKGPFDSKVKVEHGFYGNIKSGFGWTIGVYLNFKQNLGVLG